MTINTVLGKVSSEKLGKILSHEHIICCSHAMKFAFGNKWYNKEEVIDTASKLLIQAKEGYGIETIIDGTPVNLGRDLYIMQKVSEKSGVNIIASTGLYYTEDYFLKCKSSQFLAEYFIDECINGIGDSGVLPEFLKCATDINGVTEFNKKTLVTMAIVQKNTGLPMFAHNCHAKKTACEQVRIFEKNGVNFNKLVIGHSCDTQDFVYLESFLKMGCYLGFDRISKGCENMARTLVELISRGWEDKILLSHDFAVFIDSKDYTWDNYKETYRGVRDYTMVSRDFIPLLKKMDVSNNQINKMLHDNPLSLMSKN